MKVANYSFGKYGTETYEHLSFWTENGKNAYIEYKHGTRPTQIILNLGQTIFNGDKSIKVQFKNKHVLFITPNGFNLNVSDESGKKYFKTLKWEYEGPINGIGTFCNVCAENEMEAMKLVKEIYFE